MTLTDLCSLQQTLTLLSCLTGIFIEDYYGPGIDSPRNGAVFCSTIHSFQGKLHLGFKPVRTE